MLRIAGDGVTLAVLDEGEGQPVLLLHGFPDSSHLWRHQIPALVDAGMRAIAPDLRGFGESDKPEAVEEYGVVRSVADMVALLDSLGVERAHVVGHDWKLFRQFLRGDGDLERYLADLSRPGALTAGLNWYRANSAPRRELERRSFPSVAAPTLGLWGSRDNYLLEGQMVGSAEHVAGPWRYERIEGASHWAQLDASDRLNELLIEFLA